MNRFVALKGQSYNNLLILFNYVSVILIFLMAVLVFFDVLGRYFLNHPIPGTTELVKCTIIAIVFLGIAYTLQKKRHIRTTMFLSRMPSNAKTMLEILASFLCLVVFLIIVIFGWQAAWEAFQVREFDGVQFRVPVYPSRFVIVLGSILLVIQSLADLVFHVRALFCRRRESRQ
jgi:TRAP-type C4-dicarboxylate transport system permease small subunit